VADVPWAPLGGVVFTALLLVVVTVQGTRHVLNAAPEPIAAWLLPSLSRADAPPQLPAPEAAPAPAPVPTAGPSPSRTSTDGLAVSVSASLPPGTSHEGEALPAGHPWLQPVVFRPSSGDRSDADRTVREPVEPLALRRGCAWGGPGRNAYRGSVEQALVHARLPTDVVLTLTQKLRAHDITDRLDIRAGRIHGLKHGVDYDPQHLAMGFGRSLCLNARVNFAPGHKVVADLYEATDRNGRRVALMVPDVGGNVALLGERGDRRQARVSPGAPPVRAVNFSQPEDEWTLLATGVTPAQGVLVASVPEPGTLAAVLAALGAWALAVSRGRRARSPRSPQRAP
jgi:hypothetical protein